MEKKSFNKAPCSIARSLDSVGEWWSILILRNAFMGMSRFDEFINSLEIAPNMLTRRLKGLVASGVLERRRYCTRPPRYEYLLTDAGRDFLPVIAALVEWGNKHSSPDGIDTVLVNNLTFKQRRAVLIDENSGEEISAENTVLGAGPASTSKKKEIFRSIKLPVLETLG